MNKKNLKKSHSTQQAGRDHWLEIPPHEHQQPIAHTKTHLFALEGLSERGLEVAHVCYGVVIGWSADVEDGRQFVTPYICICIYVYMYMYIYIYTNIHIGRAAVRYSLHTAPSVLSLYKYKTNTPSHPGIPNMSLICP